MRTGPLSLALLVCVGSTAAAETPAERLEAAAADGKTAYVMFYRSDDDRARNMTDTIQEFVSQRSDETSLVKVQVESSDGKELVERFKASRLPLPAVFGLAPNGAVTFVRKLAVDSSALEKGITTPQCAEMVKSLQNQKVAVVCLHPAGSSDVPAGVRSLGKDSTLSPHLSFVSANADDAAEERFFQRMRVDREITEPVVLLFAPPGVYVGKYPANVSGTTLAKAIHASGKCNCQKCRHGR